MPLEQAPQLERPEVDIPDPVVDLLQTDVLTDADGGHVDPAAVPPNATVGADVADFEAIGILQRGQRRWHLADGGGVARRWRRLVERLVRALVVELRAKGVEAPLLGGETARRGPRRLRLQGAVHAFMPPVLIGAPRLDELRQDAQAHPPRRELREARQSRGGKRHAVVRADPGGQPILVKQAGEDGLRHVDGGGAQGLAAQEVATEAVGHSQRIAVAAVAGPELPFVVGPQTSLGARICVVGLPGCPHSSVIVRPPRRCSAMNCVR